MSKIEVEVYGDSGCPEGIYVKLREETPVAGVPTSHPSVWVYATETFPVGVKVLFPQTAEIARLKDQVRDMTSPYALARVWRRMATSTECGQSWEQYAGELETEIAQLRTKAERNCPICKCGANCSEQYVCEGCWHELAARTESAEAENAKLRAEVEELRRWRETHSVTATIRVRAESAEEEVEKLRAALGAYPDSDLASLATTLRTRNESLEARVAELEAFAAEAVGTHGQVCDESRCDFKSRGRALLAPREPKPTPKCATCKHGGRPGFKWVEGGTHGEWIVCPECRGGAR